MPEKIEINKGHILDKEHKMETRRNGARLYAERKCREGDFEAARKVCAKWGIAYPPGSEGGEIPTVEPAVPETISVATEESPAGGSGGQGDPVTGGGNASTGADLPIESAPQAIIDSSDEQVRGLGGEAPACEAGEAGSIPAHLTIDPKREQKARIYGSCINHRLVRIQMCDTEEIATMYKIRKNYGRNDIVNVQLVDGTPGVNAIYREIWRPV